MADLNLLFGFSIFFWILVSTAVDADPSLQKLEALHFSSELEQLKSKISFLESDINERNHELRKKDQSIIHMEEIIQEKLDRVATLESEIALLQENELPDYNEHTSKEHIRTDELEKQVDRLRKEIEVQNQKKDILEARADKTERKIHELNLKLESLQNINHEQRIRTLKTEQALQAAEEEIMKVALEESSVSKDVTEVYRGWHSRWLAVHLSHLQSLWNETIRPVTNEAYHKLWEKIPQVQQWLETHVQMIKNEWIPNLTEQWLIVTTYLEPHVRCLVTRTVDTYYKVKNSVVPQVVQETKDFTKPYIDQMVAVGKPLLEKAQISMEPFQEYVVHAYQKFINFVALYYHEGTKDFIKPYFDQVVAVVRPLMKRAQIALAPYQENVVDAYQKFINFVALYHHKVQEELKNNELTRPFAVVDLAWFVATTSLALPIFFLFNLCSRILSKRPRKHIHASKLSHTRRRAKRSYPY